MPNERILIVDDDEQVTALLTRQLTQEKYEVAIARTGNEALLRVAGGRPNLIILDLMLPDIDGYELLEQIKKSSEWSFIPVMIVTARREMEDKLRGLRLGVMDYLTKPFDRRELLARIRNILDFYRTKISQHRNRQPESSHRQVIEFLHAYEIQTLLPRFRREAKLGYQYPEVARLLQPEELGGEIFALEQMAKDGLLERIFFDTIHICPYCGHHDLNFREVCPFCESADLQILATTDKDGNTKETAEISSEFSSVDMNVDVRPPHARGTVVEVVCHACKKSCNDPIVICRCMNCGKLFNANQALTRRIYSYKLRMRSFKQPLPQPQGAKALATVGTLPSLFKELEMAHMGSEAFFRQVELQVRRANQGGSGFSLLGLHLRSIFGDALSPDRAREFLVVLKSTLRSFDLIGLKSHYEWMVLLPDTPFSMAKILATRLYAACERLAWEESLDMSMASYPEDGVRAEELLQILELGIVTIPKA